MQQKHTTNALTPGLRRHEGQRQPNLLGGVCARAVVQVNVTVDCGTITKHRCGLFAVGHLELAGNARMRAWRRVQIAGGSSRCMQAARSTQSTRRVRPRGLVVAIRRRDRLA